jgi:hypothetical protein
MAVAVAATAGRSGLVAPEVFVGRLATTAGALASLDGTAGSGQRLQPAAGYRTGEARSAVRIGDRPPVGTGSGGRGDR